MKKLLNILCGLLVAGFTHAQTTAENYIQTRTYLEPVTTSSSAAKQIQTVEYFDGLGRPKQVVNVKATPTGNDIVTPILYDSYGLQTKTYLPIPKNTTTNGNIYPQNTGSVNSPVDDVTNFYQGDKTYSESILEVSPLKRLQQQKQVGNAWSSKPMNYKYETNTSSDAVKKYDVVTTWDPNIKVFVNSNPSVQSYQANTLYKFSVKDEDGNETISFKNKQGQIVLTRKIISSTEKADTYYIYNLYNQLVYVVPPLASISPLLDTTTLGKLCYQYIYDSQNRLVEKKLPGKGWEYMVYDKQNRLVLTQDANLGANKQWLFSKYDKFARPCYTGIHISTENYNSAGRVVEQANVDAKGSNNTERSTFSFPVSGLELNYTIASSYPSSFSTLLTVNYYDTYPSDTPSALNLYSQSLLTDNISNNLSTNSLLLAGYVKNIDNNQWTKTYSWYDTKGRNTATKTQYPSGGYTSIDNKLHFSGAVLESQTNHKNSTNGIEQTITENFEYDNNFKLLRHWHQVAGQQQELLTDNTYNAMYQLTNKKVGGTLGNSLQSIDYQYNIRGWLTKINDPQNLNGKLFGYEIKAENPVNPSATSKYNGNISEIDWRSANDNVLKRYYYKYDGLDRLKDAIYEEPSITVSPVNSYGESLTYDINGNIKTLKRFSAAGTTPLMIDDLDYSIYDGNKLIRVSDIKNNSIGYPSGGNSITYDTNGNMTSHLDKGITNINYNFLDLPSLVSLNLGSSLNFKYRANGVKTQQIYRYYSSKAGWINVNTDYLDGFQYILSALQFYPTSEGYYDFQYNRYVYQYKDQVGNIRVAYYKDDSGSAVMDKVTNYYPFGMEYFGTTGVYPSNIDYTYGFQGQELQVNTGWNSFKWRNYDPTMGRFFNVDPLSEKYAYQSHYNFSENRVVDSRELEGLEIGLSWSGYDYNHGDWWNALHFNWGFTWDSSESNNSSNNNKNPIEVGMPEHVAMDYQSPEVYFQDMWNSTLNSAFGEMADFLRPMAQTLLSIGEWTGTSTMLRLTESWEKGPQYYDTYNTAFDADASLGGDLFAAPFILLGGVEGSGVKYVKAEAAGLKTLISTEKAAQSTEKVSKFRNMMKANDYSFMSEQVNIYLYEGKRYILDGHHRIQAAILENLPLEIRELTGTKAAQEFPDKVREIHQGLHK